ncbi:recombinase family protein [Desulfobacula sp.]|uniref:recombinase family protein n=1 Tax=Desulfobacula sp. TaxID=2593537 RepID=UPI0026056C01|nr:recombinase family protein [Desulfobacula sp.]
MKKLCISYSRFSSAKQAKGDSLRRQTNVARKFADKHGLEFDETIIDRGFSGFKGDHVKKGALGRLLARIENGDIPVGSVIVVENIDRLSRQKVTDATSQFLDIIRSGINIHVTSQDFTFSKKNIDDNMGTFYVFTGEISRANQESKRKTELANAAWHNKRERAKDGKLMTSLVPMWLKVENDIIEPIPERMKVVQQIFQLSEDGYGETAIVRHLNINKIKPWGKGDWYRGYITKLFKNKSVYGEYTPSKLINGKRVPQKETIPNYYPVVISKEQFDRVQRIRSMRAKSTAKPGSKNRNLFTGLVKCPYCGGSLVINTTGKKTGTYRSLVCTNLYFKTGKCNQPYASFNLKELEHAFLAYCKELDLFAIINPDSDTNALIEGKRAEKQVITAQIDKKEIFFNTLYDQMGKTPALADRFTEKMAQTDVEITGLNKELAQIESELFKLETQGADTRQHISDIKGLYEMLLDGDKEHIRHKLRHKIQLLVESIDVYPLGINGEGKDSRAFCINFHSGVFKEIGYSPFFGYYILSDSTGTDPEADKFDEMISGTGLDMVRTPLYHPYPEKAVKILMVARMENMRAEKMTFPQIAEILKNDGVVNAKGKPYSAAMLAQTLRRYS